MVAAGIVPSSTLLPGRGFLMADAERTSPGHTSSKQPPTHCATSHWMCTSEPKTNKKEWFSICYENFLVFVSKTGEKSTFWEFEHGFQNGRRLCTISVYFEFRHNLRINWASMNKKKQLINKIRSTKLKTSEVKMYPLLSINGMLAFFRLKAKQFFTLIPCVPFGCVNSALIVYSRP